MKKFLFFFIVFGLFTTAYSLDSSNVTEGSIVNSWTWEKSVGGAGNPYISTPKSIGFSKKIVFTDNGRVITYKNGVEIRNSTYQLEKGIGYSDQAEHDLLTFEGKTYVIESLDNQNLTILCNSQDGARTIYKR
ncbi:hypothetical protein [Flavobacterium reichenbachii]|uniref:Lipocalin-like domain-containing protein n=1 Tax=Flavobacterium reichenbachii TaxID=362418 RepID=A0A085ZHX1_9FLAO|nr:hypothetical protein [Flavobacterium reichenbachii]KFF04035.1 hypothetical protein IW19_00140 [Flavobacterium reichenbachii]OXB16340.1 hypothetical protein B0A68_08800 [Flavobacterium reichenbachii]